MTELTQSLERRISICAERETVFRYFTDAARFARWWGQGSTIEARPGGAILIRFPNGQGARGEVLEIDPPRRIVFSYGLGAGNPSDESIVTIALDETPEGTALLLNHAFTSAKIRDHFVQGWRHQLALFSKAVAEERHADVADRVDAYLRAWGDPDAAARRALLESCAVPGIVFRDAFSATEGREELLANLDAVQVFMPGVALAREGDVALSHGTAMARWTARRQNGETVGRGTNVYDLAPDGRLARVVGFWEK